MDVHKIVSDVLGINLKPVVHSPVVGISEDDVKAWLAEIEEKTVNKWLAEIEKGD